MVWNEYTLVINVHLPYVDPNTFNGWLITNGVFLIVCSHTLVLLFTADWIFVLFCFSGAGFIDIIRVDCNRLSEDILKLESSDVATQATISNQLRSIIERDKILDM